MPSPVLSRHALGSHGQVNRHARLGRQRAAVLISAIQRVRIPPPEGPLSGRGNAHMRRATWAADEARIPSLCLSRAKDRECTARPISGAPACHIVLGRRYPTGVFSHARARAGAPTAGPATRYTRVSDYLVTGAKLRSTAETKARNDQTRHVDERHRRARILASRAMHTVHMPISSPSYPLAPIPRPDPDPLPNPNPVRPTRPPSPRTTAPPRAPPAPASDRLGR